MLWEIAAAQRATAVRSYLLAGPCVAAVMWAYAACGECGPARAIRDDGPRLR
jgi:hypothetical protein